jgi:hypothetical protein
VQADEPNDTLATATPTGLTGVGSCTTTGFIGDGDWGDRDVDLYAFEISEGTPLPVRCTVDVPAAEIGMDGFLRLFDSSGVELFNGDDNLSGLFSLNPHIDTYLFGTGMYYVGFSTASNPRYDPTVGGSGRAGATGSYTLTITIDETAPLPDSPFEPNDTVYAATDMGSASFIVTGEFIGDGAHGRRDVDIYALILNGPARLDVEVRAAAIGSLLDPVVRLRNCDLSISERTYVDQCLVGAGDDAPDGSIDPVISGGVLEAQTVYVMVSGAGNRRYDPTVAGLGEIGSTGHYDLIVNVTYLDPTGRNEPNDSIDQAIRLPVFIPGRPDTIEIEGVVGDGRYAPFQGDRDFYEVTTVDQVRLLTVDVAAQSIGSELDPVVAVYTPDGLLLAANDNYGDSRDAHLIVPLDCAVVTGDAASVYVMVMGTKQRPPADARMPWSDATIVEPSAIDDGPGSTGPYRLTLHVDNVVNSCSNEPDDTLATATDTQLVDEGYFVCTHGLIGDGECEDSWNDVDMWSFQVVHAPAILKVNLLRCRPDAPVCYDIFLFDAEGARLACASGNDYEEPGLVVLLSLPGTYYIAIPGDDCEYRCPGYDPHVPCSGDACDVGSYDLVIELTNGTTRPALGGDSDMSGESCPAPLLFATRLDDASNQIDVIDPADGTVTASFYAPEPRFGGSEGLAYSGSNLYYVGSGRYPRLYRLDPTSGHVIDEYILWVGSGYYSDATMLDGLLYLLDYREDSVHVIDPINERFITSLEVGFKNGISIAGGLAALAGPNRLYVADAFKTRAIYEVDPQSGLVTNVNTATNRPTALGGIGSSTLYVADWETETVEMIDREGNIIGSFTLPNQVGSLAGDALANHFADFDLDGDVDLADFATFQRCFTGVEEMTAPACEWDDHDCDGHVDLRDFAGFLALWTSP